MRRLAIAARAIASLSALSALVMLSVGGVAVAASLDAFLRFPMPLRVVLLAVIAGLVAVDLRRFVVPALRFRPRPVDLALRIERQRAELSGRLASAVEFEESGLASRSALAARAVADLEVRARGMDLRGVLRLRPALTRACAMVFMLAAAGAFAIFDQESASIAARRILLPWTEAAWPARTAVEGLVSSDSVLPRGKPIALRARLTKGDAARERVFVRYRVWPSDDASVVPTGWSEVALSRQPSGEFERLVEADGARIEFVFVASDSETAPFAVRLVHPPKVVRAVATVTPPPYARDILGGRVEDLGDGRDGRAMPRASVLSGSEVVIDFELSRELPLEATASTFLASGTAVEAVSGASSGGASGGDRVGEDGDAEGDAEGDADGDAGGDRGGSARGTVALLPSRDAQDPRRWSLRFKLQDTARIEFDLVDLDGIRQAEPCVFAFEVVGDRPPSAALVEPMQDESILPEARVSMRAEHRDDIALRDGGIEVALRIAGSAVESMQLEERVPAEGLAASATLDRTLDLARLSPKPGDAVVLRAFAEDHLVGTLVDGTLRERTRSAQRVLRVVAEEEFERQVRSALASSRREAMRIDERQARARESTESMQAAESSESSAAPDVDPALAAAQGAVTEGVARMRESIEQVLGRLERNRRGGSSLSEIARQAREIASVAEARSAEASEAVAELERRRSEIGEDRSEPAKGELDALRNEVAGRQDEVRAELEDLVALLDRDEDGWIARRRLESLASDVRKLAQETGQAAQRSSGESRDQLPPDARGELDELAARMNRVATDVDKTVSDLRERAELLKQSDAMQAEGLEAAARETDDGRVREQVERAAAEAAQNRLEQSRGSLERAAEALARALQAMEEDRKVRARELARMMEELVEAVRRLLAEAEVRAAQLAVAPGDDGEEARAERDPLAIAYGMISQNTRGVASDARIRNRESARVTRFLESAATSLGSVASRLRSARYIAADAGAASDAAIRALEDALAEAERLAERAEQRAEEERRQELVAKYRATLERQVAVRALVERIAPPEPRDLTRREIVESRRLSTVQEGIRVDVAGILASEEELRDSEVLAEMHAMIDAALLDARDNLAGGRPTDAVTPAGEAIDAIAAIVAALDDATGASDDDRFGERQDGDGAGQEGGGSGGSPSGAVPAAAEVRLLKSMQEALAKRTRALAERAATMDEAARAGGISELAARQRRILDLGLRLAEKIGGQGAAPPRVRSDEESIGEDSSGEDEAGNAEDGGNPEASADPDGDSGNDLPERKQARMGRGESSAAGSPSGGAQRRLGSRAHADEGAMR